MKYKEVTILELSELAVLLEKDCRYIGVVHSKEHHGEYCIAPESILCSANLREADRNFAMRFSVNGNTFEKPYIALCRDVDILKYFEFFEEPGPWQLHTTKIRDVFRYYLKSFTLPVDTGPAVRLQVVTFEDNKMLYTLLGEVERLTGIGVLVNMPYKLGLSEECTEDEITAKLDNKLLDVLYVRDVLYIR